ncbi:MAG: S49 family peptidase [Aquamicrobium sp.]|uniref:S49 family peptidase n=1 Tax=Aquamicrobium sp. TaxID=1872579 RepID=UPI00349F050C|nr:S49 family peptidase [Aquamicrobium sp.]MCO5155581.1 S49 family peptidase [Aquamicrobium sp.]
MSAQLFHIADRVLNRPLMITQDKAQVILSVLAGRIGVSMPEASQFEGSPYAGGSWETSPFNVADGVAIITITGSLVNRGAWVGANSGLTSYEGIGHQLKTAMADDDIHAVILDLHSPGGEAVGAFETAALVRDLAAKKRTVAVVNGMACSAAYAIVSGATKIVTTETGVSGSIGVVLLHADFSQQLDREGIKPTLIHAGAHKVDANPFQPLSAAVRADLQAEVNSFYEVFVSTVAKGRGGRLSAAAARQTEARTLIGRAAVKAGLADDVGSFETVLAELSRKSAPSGFRRYDSSHAAASAAFHNLAETTGSNTGVSPMPSSVDRKERTRQSLNAHARDYWGQHATQPRSQTGSQAADEEHEAGAARQASRPGDRLSAIARARYRKRDRRGSGEATNE